MDVQFLGQPWQDGTNLDDFFADVTSEGGPHRLRIAVAWAKRSGLVRIRPHLDTWRQGGGTVDVIVGLSEGGATKQGLEIALDLADSVHLFHDVSGRTFHPKVYLAETGEATTLLVGSNNMTAGGLFFNYEAALTVKVPAPDVLTNPIMQQVEDWFDRLLGDGECCRQLTHANLPTLLNDPAYRIGDEDQRRKAAKGETGAPEEADAVTPTEDEATAAFFGRSQSAKKKARYEPPSTPGAAGGEAKPGGDDNLLPFPTPSAAPVTPIAGSAAVPAAHAAPVMRWSKKLKGTDAQQPPGANTSPTYNLRLAAARHPIDITTYFRDYFFDTTTWQPDPDDAVIEYTFVEMEVFIYGVPQGTYEFRVDHNLDRVSEQGNVPTVLKWGPMSDYMLNTNHVDDWVLLEKFDDGTFVLSLVADDPVTR